MFRLLFSNRILEDVLYMQIYLRSDCKSRFKKNIIVGISDRKEEKVNKLEEKNCKNEFGRL